MFRHPTVPALLVLAWAGLASAQAEKPKPPPSATGKMVLYDAKSKTLLVRIDSGPEVAKNSKGSPKSASDDYLRAFRLDLDEVKLLPSRGETALTLTGDAKKDNEVLQKAGYTKDARLILDVERCKDKKERDVVKIRPGKR
jgi:hypothetical protein